MYFLFQRIVTFIVGVIIVGAVFLMWTNNEKTIEVTIGAVVLSSLGIYFVISALVPHRHTSKVVGDEVSAIVFFEWPLKLVIRALGKANELL